MACFLDLCADCQRDVLRFHADLLDSPCICSGCAALGSTPRPSWSFGECPDRVIDLAAHDQCPAGYPMTLRSQDEWAALSLAWNQGIDAHLEALTERSSANPSTGKVLVHPSELKTLLRRLYEIGSKPEYDESDGGDNPAWDLRLSILTTLGIEEI